MGALGILLAKAPALGAQQTLAGAAARALAAWQSGDVRALVARSVTVGLELPGADPSAPLGREQAAHLLRRYLERAHERTLTLVALSEIGPSRGYAELERRYVIRGTRDERCETVVFRFSKVGSNWVLSEIQIVP